MAKYMIHTMPKRLWYVEDYLIPSMLAQGIDEENILVYNDSQYEGNLLACMHAFQEVDMSETGTWHLQDDVIISHDFKEVTEANNYGFVCGFKSIYDGEQAPSGKVPLNKLWFSFPCIRIPNRVALGCAKWVLHEIIGNPVYKEWWKTGVNDDMLFRKYIWQFYQSEVATNLAPNIVDHVDYLIGGTVNSSKRGKQIRSLLWKDEYLVDELAEKLSHTPLSEESDAV